MAEIPTRTRRRPHAAPLVVPLLIVLAAGIGIFWLGTSANTTVVLVLRSAEAASEPSGDPELSPAGETRVRDLGAYVARVLAGAKVDYLYAGDTRRAQQTAAPIANQFQLPINLLAPSDWESLASRIRREHAGKTVVVVGYAMTVPGVVGRLSATNVVLDQDDYGAMFLVVIPSPGSARLFRLNYGPERSPSAAPGH
jgi:phosphohistidine phosphatase SixA